MRKSVILLLAFTLLVAAAVLLWSIKNQQWQRQKSIASAPKSISTSIHEQGFENSTRTFANMPHYPSDSKSQLLQISVADTAILQRKWRDWLNAHGCNLIENADGWHEPISELRQQTLNDDLTAESLLGMRLVFDPKQDHRAEAKQVLWQATLQGSTCALMDYYFFWQKFSLAQRTIKHALNNKLYVHYTVNIPVTDSEKRQAILIAYAWDLVLQMRTGDNGGAPLYSVDLERRYHYGFQFTPVKIAQACEKAADLYDQLQSAREAAGYGPFDNSPPPILFGPSDDPDIGSHCTNWPVPKPHCQQAELHAIERNGEINAFKAWVCAADKADSSGVNE